MERWRGSWAQWIGIGVITACGPDASPGRGGPDAANQTSDSDGSVSREDAGPGTSCGPCVHGECVDSRCECDLGHAGLLCDECAPGHGGPDCQAAGSTAAPEASVLRGAAPLGVFFDAANVGGLADDNFLEADMRWDFGDANAGAYETTGKSKNRASGFVTGHVFESPGRYTVRLAIVDVAGNTFAAGAVTIEVTEFQGESRCVSTSGDFTAAPANCAAETSADLPAQLAWATAAPGRRLLLRRGDDFTLNSSIVVDGMGPTLIGAFGPADAPRPRIQCNNQGEAVDFRADDLRVVDLEFVQGGVNFVGTNQVALRLSVHDGPFVGVGIGGRQVFLADSEVVAHNYFSGYVDGSRMSLTGNRIDQLRVATSFLRPAAESRDVYVAHNIISASRPEPTTGIKWHSRRGVITDNVLSAGMSRIAITTDSGDELTAVDDDLGFVLVERNILRLSPGGANPTNDNWTDAGISFNTHHDVVIRTNLLAGMSRAFVDSSGGAEPAAQRVRIYNNSVHKGSAPGLNADEGDFLSLRSVPRDLRVHNNAVVVDENSATGMIRLGNGLAPSALSQFAMDHNVYFHTASGAGSLLNADNAAFGSSLSDWQGAGFDQKSFFANPSYQSIDPDVASFLVPSAGSTVMDAGGAVPGAYDFAGSPRLVGDAIDVGAFEQARP